MVVLSVELPSDASVMLRVWAVAETSTVTVVASTVSAKSMVAGWLTSSSAVLDWLPKPVAVTVMVYLAGAICAKTYEPDASALALSVWPFALLVMVTVAPGTSAPEGSFTVLRRDVVAVWEKSREAVERMQRSIHPH